MAALIQSKDELNSASTIFGVLFVTEDSMQEKLKSYVDKSITLLKVYVTYITLFNMHLYVSIE